MGISIAALLLLIGIAASYVSGVIGNIIFFRKPGYQTDMVLGFSLLPIFITYLAFLRIFIIPGAAIVLATLVVGIFFWNVRESKKNWIQNLRAHTPIIAVPGIVLATIAITKWQYFAGGISADGDDGRSILIISSFATNSLIPSHPYDASLPILYPYYLFMTGAWLYKVIGGIVFPSVPTYVLCLLSVGFSLAACRKAIQLLEEERADVIFIIFCLTLFSSGLLEVFRSLGLDLIFPLRDIGNFLLSGYHYLFGASIGLLGSAYAWRWIATPNENDLRISAILYLTLSFAYSGITGVWVVLITVPTCLWLLWSYRTVRIRHVASSVLPALLIVGCTMLPQFASFLPGQFTIASFATSGTWFHRSVVPFLSEREMSLTLFSKTLVVLLALFALFGPILFCTYLFAHIHAALCVVRRRITSAALLSLSLSMILVIMTFTVGNSHDWTARGLLVAILWSALFAAILFDESTMQRRVYRRVGMTLLILLLPVGLYSQWRLRAIPPPVENVKFMQDVLEHYPLGTMFYNEDPKNGRAISIIPAAGRMIISFPPPSHIAYTNNIDTLSSLLSPKSIFEPCEETWYGESTPSAKFVTVTKELSFKDQYCQR